MDFLCVECKMSAFILLTFQYCRKLFRTLCRPFNVPMAVFVHLMALYTWRTWRTYLYIYIYLKVFPILKGWDIDKNICCNDKLMLPCEISVHSILLALLLLQKSNLKPQTKRKEACGLQKSPINPSHTSVRHELDKNSTSYWVVEFIANKDKKKVVAAAELNRKIVRK